MLLIKHHWTITNGLFCHADITNILISSAVCCDSGLNSSGLGIKRVRRVNDTHSSLDCTTTHTVRSQRTSLRSAGTERSRTGTEYGLHLCGILSFRSRAECDWDEEYDTRWECGSDQAGDGESGLYENIAPIMMDTWDTRNESKGCLPDESGWET